MDKANKSARKTERFKKYIVKLIDDGESPKRLAELYSIPISTIYYWYDAYKPRNAGAGQTLTLTIFNRTSKRLVQAETELNLLRNSPLVQAISKKERMEIMEDIINKDESGKITAGLLCHAFDIDKSTFRHFRYDNKRENNYFSNRRKRLVSYIIKIYIDSHRTYGTKKIRYLLMADYHERVSEGYVRNIMQELGYKGATPRQIKRKLRKKARIYKERNNLLKQNFHAAKPNQKWISDCKHFTGEKGKPRVICMIEDLYCHKVIATHLGTAENTNIVTRTIRKAIAARNMKDNIIFHTDNGSAYSSIRCNHILKKNGFVHSYSESSNPFDDAPGESFFSHLSTELLADTVSKNPFRSERDMRQRISDYIDFYNNRRPHESNNYLVPKQKEADYVRRYKAKVDKPNS